MKYFLKCSYYLNKHLLFAITITVMIALVFGSYFDFKTAKYLILPFTILIVYPIMIGMSLKGIFVFDDKKVLSYALIVNFFFIPLIGLSIISLLFKSEMALSLGLLLIAVLPTSGGMTIAWTSIAKGNVNAAIKMTVAGLILGAIFAPFYLKVFLGQTLVIPTLTVMRQIFMIIFIPLILGKATRVILLKTLGNTYFKDKIKPKLSLISTWGLIGIIFIAISLKAISIIDNPFLVFRIIIPVTLFYITTYLLVIIIGKLLLSRSDAISLVYTSAFRSLSIALVLAMTVLGENGAEVALLVAVSYIIQILAAAWVGKKLLNYF